jgi:lysophospholipase L1-like esterase
MLETHPVGSTRRPRTLRRLGILVLVGILALAGVQAYRCYWLARPVGEGPAGPPLPREPFASRWSDRRVLLLGVGDSITFGFGTSNAHSYFVRMAVNPEDEFPDVEGISLGAVLPNLRLKNIAESGSTSIRHAKILEEFEKQDPEVFGLVVMTTGGNDLIHDYGRSPPREGAMYGATLEQALPWIESFRKRLDRMIELLEERFPGGCLIFLADVYDPTDGIGDGASAGLPDWPGGLEIHRRCNEVIHTVARERPSVRLVPIHAAFLGHGTHCTQFWRKHYRRDDPTYWYFWNLEDPNDRGYDALRRLFLIEIAKAADQIVGSRASAVDSRPKGPGASGER